MFGSVLGYYFSKRIGTFKQLTDNSMTVKIGRKEITFDKEEILYISRRSGIESFYSYYSWVVATNRSKYRILGKFYIQNEPEYDLAGIFKNMGLKVREYGI